MTEALSAGELWRAYLHGRGISDDTIERFGLHLHSNRRHIVIPVEGYERLYNPKPQVFYRGTPEEYAEPKIRWAGELGGAPPPPFPSRVAMREARVIVEGEMDALLLIQHGIPTATGTAGAGTFTPEWANVAAAGPQPKTLLYDSDASGERGMDHVAEAIWRAGGQPPLIAEWPLGSPDGFDVTDWFRTHTLTELRTEVLDTARPWQPPEATWDEIESAGLTSANPRSVLARYGPSAELLGFSAQPYGLRRYAKAMHVSPAELNVICGLLDHYRVANEWVSVSSSTLGEEISLTGVAGRKQLQHLRERGLVAFRPDAKRQTRIRTATNYYCLEPYLCVLAMTVAAHRDDPEKALIIQDNAQVRLRRFVAQARRGRWIWEVEGIRTPEHPVDLVAAKFLTKYAIDCPLDQNAPAP